MNDSDIKIFKNSSATLIWGIIFVAACLFLASSISLIFRTYFGQPVVVKEYPYFTDLDSMVNKEVSPYVDSRPDYKLLKELWNNQQCLNSQRDNILADVRQETNNSIEKISTELNFWVAIIAILGVLVPIAITYRGERDANERLSRKENLDNEKLKNFKDNLDQQISGWKQNISDIDIKINHRLTELNEWKRESDLQLGKSKTDLDSWKECKSKELEIRSKDYIEKIGNSLQSIEKEWDSIKSETDANKETSDLIKQELNLQMSTSSLASIRNNRFLETESEIKTAYNRMAHHTIKSYFKLFDVLLEKDKEFKDEENKWNMIRMSMQFYEILHNLTLSHIDPVRPRYLYDGQEAVKHLIKDLMENFPQYETIQTQFNTVKQRTEVILHKILE